MTAIKKMNILEKLHQPFVVDALAKIDWERGSDTPLVVELDPTAVCDLQCPGCISEDIIATGNSFSSKRLLELAKELKESGVKGVILIGGGEPLSHPTSGEMIEYFGKNDIAVGITTNGTFIDRYIDPIAKYSHWTRVSIDAVTEETFGKLRPSKTNGNKFWHIIENMKKLAKIKKGKLGFSYLIRSKTEGFGVVENIDEIYDAAVLAKEIGCDYFEIKPSYNYRNNVAHTLVEYTEDEVGAIYAQIKKIDSLVDEKFRIIKAITLDDALMRKKRHQNKEYTHCPVAELRTLITPLGVFVCPYWRGKEDFKLGDVKEESFQAMWHSEKRKERMRWIDPSKHCASLHCLRHESNLELLAMKKALDKGKEVVTIDEFDRFF